MVIPLLANQDLTPMLFEDYQFIPVPAMEYFLFPPLFLQRIVFVGVGTAVVENYCVRN